MFGGKPSVTLLVKGDAANLFSRQSVACIEDVHLPAAVLILTMCVGDAATVGAYPHRPLVVATDADDVDAQGR